MTNTLDNSDNIADFAARMMIAAFADDLDERIREIDYDTLEFTSPQHSFISELLDIPNECQFSDIIDILNQYDDKIEFESPEYTKIELLADAIQKMIPLTNDESLMRAYNARFK